MASKPFDSDPDSYGAKLRSKGVQVSPSGMVKHNGKPPSGPRWNNWEKGTAGEDRPGGTRMPKLDKHGSPIPIKHYSEGRYAKGEKALDKARRENTTR